MTGSQPRRVARLLADFFIHPNYVLPYIKTNIFAAASPLELELPWIAYAAIDFLNDFVKPNMSVFEYGSGGSTLFFARRCASVISIENNALWFEKIQRRLIEAKLDNVGLQHRQFDFRNPVNFESSAYLRSIPRQKFDVIVVDGMEEFIGQENAVRMRPTCFYQAENFIRPGGVIVVDDSWWYPELRGVNRAKEYRIFKSVGPCRPGVTSTDIYFY